MYEMTGDRGNTKGNLDSLQMPFIQLPDFLNDIPVVSFFFQIFDNQSVMTWIAFVAVILVWYFMYRTPTGMHLRAVGENPDAAASVGIRVQRIRYLALVLSGILAALGGIHMSMGYLTFLPERYDRRARLYRPGNSRIWAAAIRSGPGWRRWSSASLTRSRTGSARSRFRRMLPQMLPYIATVMALVIYALQNQLNGARAHAALGRRRRL